MRHVPLVYQLPLGSRLAAIDITLVTDQGVRGCPGMLP